MVDGVRLSDTQPRPARISSREYVACRANGTSPTWAPSPERIRAAVRGFERNIHDLAHLHRYRFPTQCFESRCGSVESPTVRVQRIEQHVRQPLLGNSAAGEQRPIGLRPTTVIDMCERLDSL